VCQLLGRLLDSIDNGTPTLASETGRDAELRRGDDTYARSLGVRPPPPVNAASPDSRPYLGGGEASKGAPSTSTSTPPPLSEGLLSLCDRTRSRDWSATVYARVRTGWCCKRYALEATLFGMLMPLATAGYWLTDASGLGAETGSRDRWYAAECDLTRMLVVPRLVYHHGKFADAKDVAYQEGSVWRLEPAYNASVTLRSVVRGEDGPPGWPTSWWVALHTTPTVSQRPHCDGQVLQTISEVRTSCATLRTWIPHKYLRLNWTDSQECYVDRSDRHIVYLDVDEPLSFYLDVLLICFMFAIAFSFAGCLMWQHWHALGRGFRSARSALFGRTVRDHRAATVGDTSASGSSHSSGRRCGGGSFHVLSTPENLKTACQNVVRGLHEMV